MYVLHHFVSQNLFSFGFFNTYNVPILDFYVSSESAMKLQHFKASIGQLCVCICTSVGLCVCAK